MLISTQKKHSTAWKRSMLVLLIMVWTSSYLYATCKIPMAHLVQPDVADCEMGQEHKPSPDRQGSVPGDCAFKPCFSAKSADDLALADDKKEFTLLLCLATLFTFIVIFARPRRIPLPQPPTPRRIPLFYRFCQLLN